MYKNTDKVTIDSTCVSRWESEPKFKFGFVYGSAIKKWTDEHGQTCWAAFPVTRFFEVTDEDRANGLAEYNITNDGIGGFVNADGSHGEACFIIENVTWQN